MVVIVFHAATAHTASAFVAVEVVIVVDIAAIITFEI